MKLHRLAFAVLTSLIAGSAFAQFEEEQKETLLSEIGQVLTRQAFVPGVDLSKWETFIEKRKDRLKEADSPGEFSMVVNSALKEFGLSHILVQRTGRRWGGENAQQGFGSRQPNATLRWEGEDSAVIKLSSFGRGYDEGGMTALFEEASKAKYMVIDLRGNPGGEVENMRQFLGLVLPAKTPVGTFVSRSIARDYERTMSKASSDPVAIAAWARKEFTPRRSDIEAFKGKIAVLVDKGSASASEIVANALRESSKSPIIGSPTAGAVLVSTFGRLSYGFRIQFPVGDYVSYKGLRLEGNPVKPDLSAMGENAVTVALAKLKG